MTDSLLGLPPVRFDVDSQTTKRFLRSCAARLSPKRERDRRSSLPFSRLYWKTRRFVAPSFSMSSVDSKTVQRPFELMRGFTLPHGGVTSSSHEPATVCVTCES